MSNPIRYFLAMINGSPQQVPGVVTSSGVGQGGELAALDPATGKLHESVLPSTAQVLSFTGTVDGVGVAAGDWVYVYDVGGVATVSKASGADFTKPCRGYVKDTVGGGNGPVTVYVDGMNAAVLGLTAADVGKVAFLSVSTPGGYQLARPTVVGQRCQKLGVVYPVGAGFGIKHNLGGDDILL